MLYREGCLGRFVGGSLQPLLSLVEVRCWQPNDAPIVIARVGVSVLWFSRQEYVSRPARASFVFESRFFEAIPEQAVLRCFLMRQLPNLL